MPQCLSTFRQLETIHCRDRSRYSVEMTARVLYVIDVYFIVYNQGCVNNIYVTAK